MSCHLQRMQNLQHCTSWQERQYTSGSSLKKWDTRNKQRHANADQQCYGGRSHQWENATKTHQSNGHASSLVKRQGMPGTIQNIMATRKLNYANYWTKHHPAAHHRNTRKEFLTPYTVLEMLRIEQNSIEARAA